MARIRTIKPEFWKHEDLSALPEATHMLAGALLNHSDDEGYFNANPMLVKAECCPLREPSVSIQDSLISLQEIGYLKFFNGTDGKRYGRVVTFDDHQRVNRPTPSKIKPLCILTDNSVSDHPRVTEGSPPERKGKEGKGKEQGSLSALESAAQNPGRESQGQGGSTPPALKLVTGKPAPVDSTTRICDVVLAAYHETLPGCRRMQVLTPKGRKRILAADKLAGQVCKQQQWEMSRRDFWMCYFQECLDDPWLRGDVANPNNPRWKQNLLTLIDEDRFAEIMDRAITASKAEQDKSGAGEQAA